jgi:hypothetical protein
MDIPRVAPAEAAPWPIWQRVLFRFFFIYLILQVAPWNWFGAIPGIGGVLGLYYRIMSLSVEWGNAHFFHVRDKLIMPNGSGDTSFAFAQICLYLSVAIIGCVAWSVLDRKRSEYSTLMYWLRTSLRFYVATAALSYGVIKIFAMQMAFPTTSQLATPLGDLLPMRFSWLFIGYSLPYQIFSGLMETTAGVLLFYRRTVTAGLFAATGAFMNVVMINLSYDVPVKLYASHLLLACVFLLATDSPRLVNLLFLNRATPPTTAYEPRFTKPWHRWAALAVYVFFVYQFVVMLAWNDYKRYLAANAPPKRGPFAEGVYDVKSYVVNKTPVPATTGDTIRWKDLIIDSNAAGSVNSLDPVFWTRYRRGYFRYKPDTVAHTAVVWKISTIPRDSTYMFTMRYEVPDSNTIRLHTVIRGDSIHVELARMARHFQLTERQFHWLSEYNR